VFAITRLLCVMVPFIFINDMSFLRGFLFMFSLMMFYVVFVLLEEFTNKLL